MRPLVLGGIVLIALGAFLLVRGGTFTTQRSVVEVGDLKISADERRTIPPLVGGALAIAGVVMVVAGARKKG